MVSMFGDGNFLEALQGLGHITSKHLWTQQVLAAETWPMREDSCVTSGVAIVYNHAHRAKQGAVLRRGRWGGYRYFGPPGQAENYNEGVAQVLEKRADAFADR